MRVLLLAGLLSGVLAPSAFAIGDSKACQIDETRRGAESAASPTPAEARQAAAPPRAVPAEPARTLPPRRRGGRRIPDSELIGSRGAL